MKIGLAPLHVWMPLSYAAAPVPAAAVPLSVAVPLPLFVNVNPVGRPPITLGAATGEAVVATVKVFDVPTVNVAWLTLVIASAFKRPAFT